MLHFHIPFVKNESLPSWTLTPLLPLQLPGSAVSAEGSLCTSAGSVMKTLIFLLAKSSSSAKRAIHRSVLVFGIHMSFTQMVNAVVAERKAEEMVRLLHQHQCSHHPPSEVSPLVTDQTPAMCLSAWPLPNPGLDTVEK